MTFQPAGDTDRDWWQSVRRGWAQKCPCCGKGALYKSYLKVDDACPNCATELHHHRADDAPPYFVMLITGHVIVGLILTMEQTLAPPIWLQLAISLPLLVILSLILLPRVKGALIGYQWALRMHGFGGDGGEDVPVPPTTPAGEHP